MNKIEQQESNRFYYAILDGYKLLYGDEDYEKLMKALGENVIIKSSKYEESKKSTVDDIIEMYKRDKEMEEIKLDVMKQFSAKLEKLLELKKTFKGEEADNNAYV